MISYGEVKRFHEEMAFVKVTDFAKSVKRKHKAKKTQKKKNKKRKG